MNHPTPKGVNPPVPGADKEEPELTNEEDIPSDDGGTASSKEQSPKERPPRDVERE